MEFRILGPLEIRGDDGRELPLGRGRERSLLALLLLHANEVVSLDRIIDELWGERPPPTAGKIVRNLVSHLRHGLGSRLATVGHGYRLDVPRTEVDVARFDALAEEGRRQLDAARPGDAAETLAGALSLWRGPALGEFAYERFAQGEITRLQERREAALEDQVEAKLALGLHSQVVGELEELVAVHPLRERLRGQLMLALYRSGRQAEALEEYQKLRAALVDELGLEPTEELRLLERAILAHDPALAPPRRPPRDVSERRDQVPRPWARKLGPRALAVSGTILALGALVVAGVLTLGGESEPPLATVAGNEVVAIDAETVRVQARVPVGDLPGAVAVGYGSVWIGNSGDGTISRLDAGTRRLVATIGVPVPPSRIAVGLGSVWVAGGGEGVLVRIDPRTNTPVDTFDLGGANELAPDGVYSVAVGAGAVWVGSSARRVLRIDPATGHVSASIRLGHVPSALAAADGDVWVSDLSGRISRIDGGAGRVTASAEHLPWWPLSLVAGTGSVWVGSAGRNVWRIDPDTAKVEAAIPVDGKPVGLAVDGHDLWIATRDPDAVLKLDTRSRNLASLILDAPPLDIAVGAGAAWATLGVER